jgi:hypothetical protein
VRFKPRPTTDEFTYEFGCLVCQIFSKAAAMSAFRFCKISAEGVASPFVTSGDADEVKR